LKCIVCDREAAEKYCGLHEKAYQNVVQKFEDWKRAIDVSWKQYLETVLENSFTGAWAKEVAKQLLSEIE
jgi:hypothetical protein